MHPTTTEIVDDELNEVVAAEVSSEIDCSIISYAETALAMNGKAYCYSTI